MIYIVCWIMLLILGLYALSKIEKSDEQDAVKEKIRRNI